MFSGKDEVLVCKNCKQQFMFSVEEQKFYEKIGFDKLPARCRTCRAERKAARMAYAEEQQHQEQQDVWGARPRRRGR